MDISQDFVPTIVVSMDISQKIDNKGQDLPLDVQVIQVALVEAQVQHPATVMSAQELTMNKKAEVAAQDAGDNQIE